MEREKLIQAIAFFLEREGSQNTAELISDAIDSIKPASESAFYHRAIAKDLLDIGAA